MKKITLTCAAVVSAFLICSCGAAPSDLSGTWVYNPKAGETSTLVISSVSKDKMSFYIESERREVYKKLNGVALLKGDTASFYRDDDGCSVEFFFKKENNKVLCIVLKGKNDSAFFDGSYAFSTNSKSKPVQTYKIIDGYYRLADGPLVRDIYLNKGKIVERQLENGEVTGGREIGTFLIEGNKIRVSVEDPATGKFVTENWIALDDNTIKDPGGRQYTFYVP